MRENILGVVVAVLLLSCSADNPGSGDGAKGSGDDAFGNAGDEGDGDGTGLADLLGSDDDDGVAGGLGGSGNGGPAVNRETPDSTGPCQKVDVIFSVDGSGSMAQELQAMRDTVFPAFAAKLNALGGGAADFRVGVLDACPTPSNLHTRGNPGQCNFAGNNKWIENVSPNFNAEVACVGDLFQQDINCSGNNDDEQPASAIAVALENAGTGQANAGFLRGDALLVAIGITDEDEQPTTGSRNARDVYDRMVNVVGGDVSRMVFLGIGGNSDCVGPYGDAREASTLRNITGMFESSNRGVWWDLCQGRLEDGLDEVFKVIEDACEELPPAPYTPPSTPVEPCGVDMCTGGNAPPRPTASDAGAPD